MGVMYYFMVSKHSVNINTVKPVLSGHSKIDETKALKTSDSLVQVKSIAECLSIL